MDQVVFHSFYEDPELDSLKHALLYFGKVCVPSNSLVLDLGPRPEQAHYIQLIPDHVYNDIEFLEKEGAIELRKFSGGGQDPIVFYEAILEQVDITESYGPYSLSDVEPIMK